MHGTSNDTSRTEGFAMKGSQFAVVVAIPLLVLLLGLGVVDAVDISGTISSTLMIFEDSQLVGDVTCTVTGGPGVPAAPCIQFGAPGIKLKLNGFTMTGKAPITGCGGFGTQGENGIDTDLQNDVVITGPGLVQRFRANGIRIGSTGVKVKWVTAADNCVNGIVLVTASNNDIKENVVVRNGATVLPGGGIRLATESHSNRIRQNVIGGNGYVGPLPGPENDAAISILSGNDNVVEDNSVAGNTNGILLEAGTSGNVVRRNVVVGNPPIQVSDSFPQSTGVDIRNFSALGANTFKHNVCLTALNAPCPSLESDDGDD